MLDRPQTIVDKALAAVGGEWRTAREIFAIVGEGAFTSTRSALARLAEAGHTDRRLDPHHSGEIARYRLIPASDGPVLVGPNISPEKYQEIVTTI